MAAVVCGYDGSTIVSYYHSSFHDLVPYCYTGDSIASQVFACPVDKSQKKAEKSNGEDKTSPTVAKNHNPASWSESCKNKSWICEANISKIGQSTSTQLRIRHGSSVVDDDDGTINFRMIHERMLYFCVEETLGRRSRLWYHI